MGVKNRRKSSDIIYVRSLGVVFMWQLQLLYNIVTDKRHDMIFESFLTFNSLQFTAVLSCNHSACSKIAVWILSEIHKSYLLHVWLSQTQMSTIKTMEILTNLHTTIQLMLVLQAIHFCSTTKQVERQEVYFTCWPNEFIDNYKISK